MPLTVCSHMHPHRRSTTNADLAYRTDRVSSLRSSLQEDCSRTQCAGPPGRIDGQQYNNYVLTGLVDTGRREGLNCASENILVPTSHTRHIRACGSGDQEAEKLSDRKRRGTPEGRPKMYLYFMCNVRSRQLKQVYMVGKAGGIYTSKVGVAQWPRPRALHTFESLHRSIVERWSLVVVASRS